MENNDNYKVEDTPKGKKITFDKGCVVDYEELWNRILVDNLIENKHVSSFSGVHADSVVFNKKIVVEIKAITRDKKTESI